MMLLREEVSYDVLGNGIKGIRLGSWAFLMVKKQGQWTLSLWDTENRQALTSSVHLKRVDQLPTSRAAKTLRDMLKKEGPNVVEWVLMEIKSQPGTFVTGEVEEEQEKIVIMVPTVITEEFIAEEVWQPPKPPKFIVRHFDKDNFEEKQEISLGEEDLKGRPIIYRPVYNDHLRKGMVIVPRKPVECTIEEVIQEAMVFLFVGFDACGRENEAKLLGLSALSSWILDKERSVLPIAGIGLFAPILAIRGPSGSGKNRFANMLRFLSYHPFFDVSTYRIPSLYRPLDIWKGTLVIDEGDLKSTGATSSLIHFLNSRATGTPIGRQNPDKPSKCDAFDSFGITIIAQRRHFDDNATEGRTLPFMADISDNKDIPTLETKEMIEKGMELQDKLLFLRLKYWKKIEIEKTRWVAKVTDHRLNSALLPIMALSKFAPWIEDFIEKIILPIERERRKIKAQSADGLIINVLWDKIDQGLWDMHNGLYYFGDKRETQDETDDEEVIEIVKPLTSSNLSEITNRSSKDVRKILTSLNIDPKDAPERFRVGRFNVRGVMFDPKRFEKRLREFVVDYNRDELYEKLNLVPDVPNVPDNTPLEVYLKGGSVPDVPNVEAENKVEDKNPREIKSGTNGTSGTQLKIQQMLSTLVQMQRETGVVEKIALLNELEQKYRISTGEAEPLIGQLLREGTIYSPREGCLKKT